MDVTDIRTQGEDVVVEFDDGHKAVFVPYRHGLGYQVEGLRNFILYRGDNEVAWFDSRLHRAGPSGDEHRLVRAADGYTPERISEYWRCAREYIHQEYFQKPYETGRESEERLWYPWKVVCTEGGSDCNMLEEGKIERTYARTT